MEEKEAGTAPKNKRIVCKELKMYKYLYAWHRTMIDTYRGEKWQHPSNFPRHYKYLVCIVEFQEQLAVMIKKTWKDGKFFKVHFWEYGTKEVFYL